MGWAKPSGCGDIYGYRLTTQSWRGSEAARSDEHVGRSEWGALPPVSCHGVGGMRSVLEKSLCNEPRRNTAPVAWLGPSLPGVICSASHASPFHQEVSLIDTCLGGR